MSERKQVAVWTDGACLGNPGPGGYAAVLLCGEHRREVVGGRRRTTNNRMELLAVIAGLRALKTPCRVTVSSDSRYVVDGVMSGAMRRWRQGGWLRGGRVVPNADLWAELDELAQAHELTLSWVPGHAGLVGNERCHQLAEAAARGVDLPADSGYEDTDAVRAAVAPTLFDRPAPGS